MIIAGRSSRCTRSAPLASLVGCVLCAALSIYALAASGASARAAAANVQADRAHCPQAAKLLAGDRAGAISAGRRFVHDTQRRFQLIKAHRARQGDLGFARYSAACRPPAVARTWYVELHPPGPPCSACNAHLYVVKSRRTGWRVLSYFSG